MIFVHLCSGFLWSLSKSYTENNFTLTSIIICSFHAETVKFKLILKVFPQVFFTSNYSDWIICSTSPKTDSIFCCPWGHLNSSGRSMSLMTSARMTMMILRLYAIQLLDKIKGKNKWNRKSDKISPFKYRKILISKYLVWTENVLYSTSVPSSFCCFI